MKQLRLIFIAILGLLGTSALAQNSLPEAVAPGNKVYFEIINDADHPIPPDEVEDVTRELIAAGSWKQVSDPEEADFIFHVDVKKKVVFFSPRTWLTPSVRLQDGTVLWQGKTYIGDATMGNGFRATDAAVLKMLKQGFKKDLFPKIGR